MGRKKQAVQDKYYKLAKEQGYRARSSFKLVQLNRKYDLLGKATRVIDLCAAPGGWLQVCVKSMPKTPETKIIGVDLMPIKPIRGCVTFQSDITTQECRHLVRKEMGGLKAQVVLCDGAPNVGADYSKDAFVQNELTVHALKFACEHLVKGGVFVTKVFRSSDYNALMWSFNQLFRKVEATKPPSSRNVSAEIFVVCRGYLAPTKIDPRMLDPKFVLDTVEGEDKSTEASAVGDLFHKKNKQKKNRGGYDESAGQTLHRSFSAQEYFATDEPIQMLAGANEIHFKDDESQWLLKHRLTTEEIKECLSDLKVLGNPELRLVLRWRSNIKAQLKKEREAAEAAARAMMGVKAGAGADEEDAKDSDSSDIEDIEAEIKKVRESKLRREKREDKRMRRERAKFQRRVDLGMENEYAIDLNEESGPFSAKSMGLKSVRKLGEVEANVAAKKVTVDDDDDDNSARGSGDEEEEDDNDEPVDPASAKAAYLARLEDEAAHFYSGKKKTLESAEPLSVQQRRQQITADKKAKMKKRTLEALTAQDFTNALQVEQAAAVDRGDYAKMLAASDDEGSESDASEGEKMVSKPLPGKKVTDPVVAANKRADRWFKQSVFDDIETDESDSEDERGPRIDSESDNDMAMSESEGDEEDESESESDEDEEMGLPSARTDKAKRREKRLKLKVRNERKEEKRKLAAAKEAKALKIDQTGMFDSIATSEFETAPAEGGAAGTKRPLEKDEDLDGSDSDDEGGATTEKSRWARKMIRKGLGRNGDVKEASGFEVVPKEERAEVDSDDDEAEEAEEEEAYNSEDYDVDTRAQHLVLGSMMTKKSKRRKLLDAAYNRYAFNDDELPDWFVEDENKHNRPQLPITKEMVEAVKARYKDLAAKPINKVAEARARKRRRLMAKVEKIKKQAAAVVDQPDLTARSKMKAIEKLYKGAKIDKPGSVYAVASRAGGSRVSKGAGNTKGKKVKVVDRRMKADLGRGRAANERKKGRKGGKGKGGKGGKRR